MGPIDAVGRPQIEPNSCRPVAVAVITFGHPNDEVATALESALDLRSKNYPLRTVVLDDSSGNPPDLDCAEVISTPGNAGYASALNFLAQEVCREEHRLVLINPDASIEANALARLCWPDDPTIPIVVPRIPDATALENVRELYSVNSALLQIMVGRLGTQALMNLEHSAGTYSLGRPWVPAGTIASFDLAHLRQNKVDNDMFWIEMSAYARENAGINFQVIDDTALHTGDSTRKHAGMAVRASLLHARCSYVRKYGSWIQKRILTTVVLAGLTASVCSGNSSYRDAITLVKVGLGREQWNNVAS